MNILILEGFLGSQPKQIAENTFAVRLAVHNHKGETLWVDGLCFNKELLKDLSVGQRILINGKLTKHNEGSRSPKIIVETIEVTHEKTSNE